MSEFVRDIADKYAKLMAPAFMNGLQTPVQRDERLNNSAFAIYLFLPAIRDGLQAVDWQAHDLPIKQYEGPVDSFKPRDKLPADYGESLMALAFDDVAVILQLCEGYRAAYGLPDGYSFSEILHNSKKSLLNVSRLQEQDKKHIYLYLNYPDVAEQFEGATLPKRDQTVQLKTDKNGKPRFVWHDGIQEFIDDHLLPDRGCPADNIIIETEDGRKQILTYYFWDKLVDFAYSAS